MGLPGKGLLLDFLKGSLATLALFIGYVSLPLVGILPGIFAPLPAMHYTLKAGKPVGTAIVLTSMAVLAILAGPTVTVLYLVQAGIISLSIPIFLLRGWGGARVILSSIALCCFCLLALVAYLWLVRGVDLNGMILKGIDSSISQTISLYEKGGVTGVQLDNLRQGMKQAGNMVSRIYPSLVLILFGAVAGLNLQALKKLAEKYKCTLRFGDFIRYRNPEHLVWLVIFSGFALLIKDTNISTAALNLLIATLSLYFVQGMAIAVHFFQRFSIPLFVRVIFYTLLTLQPYLLVGLAALGLFDLWGNFRAPKLQKNL